MSGTKLLNIPHFYNYLSSNEQHKISVCCRYAGLLGFAIPIALIIVFYTLIVIKLKSVGPKKKSKEKKKTHRKVTKMVLTVIAVYVICWLPYWVFQVGSATVLIQLYGISLCMDYSLDHSSCSISSPINQ